MTALTSAVTYRIRDNSGPHLMDRTPLDTRRSVVTDYQAGAAVKTVNGG